MNLTLNILTTLSARLVILFLALVSSVILARVLGPEGRGLFALVLLLPEFASTFGLLGFEQSNTVYAGLEPQKRKTLVWQSAVIAGVVGSLMAIAGIVYVVTGAPGFQSLIRGPLWLYVLPLAIIPLRIVTEYWGAILRGMNRIVLLNVVEVGTKVTSLIVVVLLVALLQFGVRGAVWADFVVALGGLIIMGLLLRHVDVWGRPAFDRSLCIRSGKFALPAHCGNVLAYLNYRVDQFIIAALLPPEHLGFYVIAVGLVERLWILPGSVANALLPHLTNSPKRDPALPAVIARHVMVWTGLVCAALFVIADVLVRVLYSPAFEQAVAPLRWLLPGIFALSISKVLVAEMSAREKINYVVWVGIVAVTVNIAGNLLLVPRMGISGAALASTISYSLLSLIVIWYYLRQTGVRWTALLPCKSDVDAYVVLWRKRPFFRAGLTTK